MGRVLASHARAVIVTVSAAAAVLLSGCSDGAGAQPGPSSGGPPSHPATSTSTGSASPATTSSPSGTASVAVPAAARAHTKEGALAFAKFYYEMLGDSQYRADSSGLRQLSTESCVACQAFARKADSMRARGQHLDSRSLQIAGAQVTPASVQNGFIVDVLGDDRPSKVLSQDGSVVSASQGAKLTFRTQVLWTSGAWKVSDSKLVKS